jgi:hypothetical protein
VRADIESTTCSSLSPTCAPVDDGEPRLGGEPAQASAASRKTGRLPGVEAAKMHTLRSDITVEAYGAAGSGARR